MLRGEEFVNRPEVVRREGVGKFNSLQNGTARIVMNGDEGGRGNIGDIALAGAITSLTRTLSKLTAIRAGEMLRMGVEEDPDFIPDSINKNINDGGKGGVGLVRTLGKQAA
jgi:hypothetical protein